MAVIGAVIVVAMLLLATSETRPKVLKVFGLSLAVGSVLFILLIGTTRSPLVASIEDANAKVIAGNMFSTLTSSLATQSWLLALAGVVLAGAGYLLPRARHPTGGIRKATAKGRVRSHSGPFMKPNRLF